MTYHRPTYLGSDDPARAAHGLLPGGWTDLAEDDVTGEVAFTRERRRALRRFGL